MHPSALMCASNKTGLYDYINLPSFLVILKLSHLTDSYSKRKEVEVNKYSLPYLPFEIIIVI